MRGRGVRIWFGFGFCWNFVDLGVVGFVGFDHLSFVLLGLWDSHICMDEFYVLGGFWVLIMRKV